MAVKQPWLLRITIASIVLSLLLLCGYGYWCFLPSSRFSAYITSHRENDLEELCQLGDRALPLVVEEMLSSERIMTGLWTVLRRNEPSAKRHLTNDYCVSSAGNRRNKAVRLLAELQDFTLLEDWITYLESKGSTIDVKGTSIDGRVTTLDIERELRHATGKLVPPIVIVDASLPSQFDNAFHPQRINPRFLDWLDQNRELLEIPDDSPCRSLSSNPKKAL